MKRMTVGVGVVLFGAVLVSSAVAQGQVASGQSGQWQKHSPVDCLTTLNLTADQKTQIKTIMDQARTDAKNATDPQAEHQVFQAAFEKIKTTVLTADQVKQ